MNSIEFLLNQQNVHDQWKAILEKCLACVDADYLNRLIHDESWLPGRELLLSAFKRDKDNCRYILFGESPYPRKQSANGIAFYDAAVTDLWSEKGLSKSVNKATSLRNIMKTALFAEGLLAFDGEGKITQQAIAQLDKGLLIQTIEALFSKLQNKGFLLLNTTPVLHPLRKPAVEAKYWRPFVEQLLIEMSYFDTKPTIILWGKVAQEINAFYIAKEFNKLECEHPYNLSFIQNQEMQQLFKELCLLTK